jgi:hypothetical protein
MPVLVIAPEPALYPSLSIDPIATTEPQYKSPVPSWISEPDIVPVVWIAPLPAFNDVHVTAPVVNEGVLMFPLIVPVVWILPEPAFNDPTLADPLSDKVVPIMLPPAKDPENDPVPPLIAPVV